VVTVLVVLVGLAIVGAIVAGLWIGYVQADDDDVLSHGDTAGDAPDNP
jgi:hypothetical protein